MRNANKRSQGRPKTNPSNLVTVLFKTSPGLYKRLERACKKYSASKRVILENALSSYLSSFLK